MSLSRSTRRSRPGALAALAAAGALVSLLSGCVAGDPVPSPSPSADAAEPIFASDEEALAAAELSYETYISTIDQVTRDGGGDAERIRAVVDDTYVEELLDSAERLKASGNRTLGETTFDQLRLVERSEHNARATVTTYVCVDVSNVRVVSAEGVDVTPAERPSRRALQATFVSSVDEPTKLLPSGSEQWAGKDFC